MMVEHHSNHVGQQSLRFAQAWVDGRWQRDVTIGVSELGLIESIESGGGSNAVPRLEVAALPGMANVHSHAFQRAFAGLGEYRTGERDSFWTWRSLMYDFVSRITPEDLHRIARQLYREMLNAGYTWVGEFHYLHNDLDGRTYSRLEELAEAISLAATEVGIGLCLLPVLYQRGGFRNEPLVAGQHRFALTTDSYLELLDRCRKRISSCPNQRLGVALHSLRAIGMPVARTVLEQVLAEDPTCPIHIHVAEQVAEVEQCMAVHGKRPVEYLFDEWDVDDRWCLIHATHLSPGECSQLASSRAVVGLCPTTEANLGDGLFPAAEYLKLGGRIAIGSDSHVSLDFREELRWLEYGQRLHTRSRAILGDDQVSAGRRLYTMAAAGGAAALGIPAGEIRVGLRADFTLVDPHHASIGEVEGDRFFDRLLFCNQGDPIYGVCVGGRIRERPRGG